MQTFHNILFKAFWSDTPQNIRRQNMCPNEHDGKYIPSCGSKYTYNYCSSPFAVKLFFVSHEQYPDISYTFIYCSSPFAVKLIFTSHEQYPDISYTFIYCSSPFAVKLIFTSHEQYPDFSSHGLLLSPLRPMRLICTL